MDAKSRGRILPIVAALGFALAGCASSGPQFGANHHPRHHRGQPIYRVEPYQVKGVWYYPRADYNYDETGTASWYGPGFDQQATADGEIFIGRDTPGSNIVITGTTHETVAAKIGAIENSNPDQNSTAVPAGDYPFGQFRFLALSHNNSQQGLNKVTITDLVFTVTTVNAQISAGSFLLYNKADATATKACTADLSSGTIVVTCADIDTTSLVNTVIDPSGSIALVLQGEIIPGSAGGARQVQASLQQLGDRNVLGTVEWKDGDITARWVDLPVTSVRSTLYRSQ